MATNNIWNSSNPASVISGGTGDAALSPTYSVLCAGTTTTNPVQVVTSNGNVSEYLTSNGVGVLPTWQPVAPSMEALVLIQTQTVSNVASVFFTSGINSTYSTYLLIFSNVRCPLGSTEQIILAMQFSTNGGLSYINTLYGSLCHDGTNIKASSFYEKPGTSGAPNPTSYLGLANGRTTIGLGSAKICGKIFLYNLGLSEIPSYVGDYLRFQTDTDGDGAGIPSCNGETRGGYRNTINVNAIRIFSPQQNISTGIFSLYGILN